MVDGVVANDVVADVDVVVIELGTVVVCVVDVVEIKVTVEACLNTGAEFKEIEARGGGVAVKEF